MAVNPLNYNRIADKEIERAFCVLIDLYAVIPGKNGRSYCSKYSKEIRGFERGIYFLFSKSEVGSR
jgi:hypothetical protein